MSVAELAREIADHYGLNEKTVHGEIQWFVNHTDPTAYDVAEDAITDSAADAVRNEYRLNSMP